MKTVNVLWTGGWDSTFRILQLSTKDIIIQPYYLKDNRKSEKNELETIHSLTEEVRNLTLTKCVLKEVIAVNVSDIIQDKDISQAYKDVNNSFKKLTNRHLGSQYEWLARFSKDIHNLELSIENEGILVGTIKKYGEIKKVFDHDIGEYYTLDNSVSQDNIIKIFGNYNFPLLDYSKLMMKKEAEEDGFMHLMNKTWFCHRPIDNAPCGTCSPCEQAIDAGLEYRLTDVALQRYKKHQFFYPIKKTIFFRGIKYINRILKTK